MPITPGSCILVENGVVAYKRHSKIPPDKLSMRESVPKPINAMLPANTPAPRATAASVKFQPSVKYSNRRPRAKVLLPISRRIHGLTLMRKVLCPCRSGP